MRILITGGSGFIGSLLCRTLAPRFEVTGTFFRRSPGGPPVRWRRIDLLDPASVEQLVREVVPDVVIHCAGVKRVPLFGKNRDLPRRVNGGATEFLGLQAGRFNPRCLFVYLSSVSVYGPGHPERPLREEDPCRPAGVNGISKLEGERRLRSLVDRGVLQNVLVLRLAPCYDRIWTRNLERRILFPGGFSYVRYGSGEQRMSALSRDNVADWMEFVLSGGDRFRGFQVYNLCDERPYSFNEMIRIFKESGRDAPFPDLPVPPAMLRRFYALAKGWPRGSRIALRSYVEKICRDMVYAGEKMLGTGFRPAHSLETVLR
jgi:nucleoside-diphosphate-sugar epimerase